MNDRAASRTVSKPRPGPRFASPPRWGGPGGRLSPGEVGDRNTQERHRKNPHSVIEPVPKLHGNMFIHAKNMQGQASMGEG
jgi:hypothetical protein